MSRAPCTCYFFTNIYPDFLYGSCLTRYTEYHDVLHQAFPLKLWVNYEFGSQKVRFNYSLVHYAGFLNFFFDPMDLVLTISHEKFT